MKKIPITIETMPLIRHRDLLLINENYIPITYRGSGLEGKDISLIDGKQSLNIYAKVEDLMNNVNEWYNGQEQIELCNKGINRSVTELLNILHFSITPFCDKFTLQLKLKQLDQEKNFWSIGTKEYSTLFGLRKFDYSILQRKLDIEKVDAYIKDNLLKAEKNGYRAVIWNVPGGIDKRIEEADSSNFVHTIAQRKISLCIISIPYTYDIEEIASYVEYVKRKYNLKVDFVSMSNLIVDWSKSKCENNKIFYYAIKKNTEWTKKLDFLKKESSKINIIDADDPKDITILWGTLNHIIKKL